MGYGDRGRGAGFREARVEDRIEVCQKKHAYVGAARACAGILGGKGNPGGCGKARGPIQLGAALPVSTGGAGAGGCVCWDE